MKKYMLLLGVLAVVPGAIPMIVSAQQVEDKSAVLWYSMTERQANAVIQLAGQCSLNNTVPFACADLVTWIRNFAQSPKSLPPVGATGSGDDKNKPSHPEK